MSYIFLFLISTLLTFTAAGISDSEDGGVSPRSQSPERLFEPLYDPGLPSRPSSESLISDAYSDQSSELRCDFSSSEEDLMVEPPTQETITFVGLGATPITHTFPIGSNDLEQREWLAQRLLERFYTGQENTLSFLHRCEISQDAIKHALSDPVPFHVESRLPRNLQKLLDQGGKVYLNPAHLPNVRDTIRLTKIDDTSKQYTINRGAFEKLSCEQVRANIGESPFLIIGNGKLLGCIFCGFVVFVADLTEFDLVFDPQIAILVNSLPKMDNVHRTASPLILSLCVAGRIKEVLHIRVAMSAEKCYFEGPNAIFPSVPENLKNIVELDGKQYFIQKFLQNAKPFEVKDLSLRAAQTCAEILLYNSTKYYLLQIPKSDATQITEAPESSTDKPLYKFYARMLPSGILGTISREDGDCKLLGYPNVSSPEEIEEIFKSL